MANAGSTRTNAGRVKRLTCPVCMEVFRQPTLLPCHHTFCLSCLHDLLATSPRAPEFRCPTCRTLAHVPPGGMSAFQSNFYLLPEELEAARRLAAQDVPGPSHFGPRDVASPQRPTAGDGAGEATDDWLIAVLMNMEGQGGQDSSRPIFVDVAPEQGGGQDDREEGGGGGEEDELRRAQQESLWTYRAELQRRPQPGSSPSSLRHVAAPQQPTTGDEAVTCMEMNDGAGETTDDWLIAFLMNMEEQGDHDPSRSVSLDVVPQQGGGHGHQGGGGREEELSRALQESLRTYRAELQRPPQPEEELHRALQESLQTYRAELQRPPQPEEELHRALQESLRTYREELQRH